MGRDNGFKVLAVIALAFAVIGISVGFAAFSATLNINSYDVNVSPENTFDENINYEDGSAALSASSVSTTTDSSAYTAADSTYKALVTVGTATDKTWSGIEISAKEAFTAILTATVENKSEYTGYLKTITSEDAIVCAPVGTGDSAITTTKLTAMCTGTTTSVVSVKVEVGSVSDTKYAGYTGSLGTAFAGSGSATIAKTSGTQTVTITITYNPGTNEVDGDFKVTIPAIKLGYSTAA